MICSSISDMLGFVCHPLSDDGNIAMIDTPFVFPDGDEIPVFVEKIGDQVRFFDDGGAILHLLGKGIALTDHRNTKFLRNLCEPHGVFLTDRGELEISTSSDAAPTAFARYISTMLALCNWEVEQNGTSTDTSLLLDEVVMCLRAWKSTATLSAGREFIGISGHSYKMDLEFDGVSVLAIGIHPAAVSSTAKKLLDIRAASENDALDVMVVIDDRADSQTARREGLVLNSVSKVMMMTKLQKQAERGAVLPN